jgi:hypothetical protein
MTVYPALPRERTMNMEEVLLRAISKQITF